MPHDVIMPALGMAQDTGLIVAWHKAPGDAVKADDILFEVETDKAVMEVLAGADGFVAALHAEAGSEAPVGETIAVITEEKPDLSAPSEPVPPASATPTAPMGPADREDQPATEEHAASPAPKPKSLVANKAPTLVDGRILASPKARRLALEEGLDLRRLAEAGHPQPYRVADLEVLRSLPTPAAVPPTSRRLAAAVPSDGFAGFAAWAADHAGNNDAQALLAGLAAGSLGIDHATIAVETFGRTRHYEVPAGPLSEIVPASSEARPDLRLRDLRLSRVDTVELGAEDAPVLTLTRTGDGVSITLECAAEQLTAGDALALISEFAGRMEQPLRHLL